MPSELHPPLQWDPDEPLGTLIRRVRTWWGKSQVAVAAQLSELSGNTPITGPTISHWERDARIPQPYWHGYLSKTLDIPLDVLDRAAAVSAAGRSQPRAHGGCPPPPGDPPAGSPPHTSPGTAGPDHQPATGEVRRPDAGAAGAAMPPGPMLTTAQAITMLGVTAPELASLVTTGLLRPGGSGDPSACRYPVSQIEALLNRPGGSPRDVVLLHALGQAIPAIAGPGPGCQLDHRGQHPQLLIRTASGTQLTVWAVPTSAGWRFLWNQWRSHPAADLRGAATAIAVDLGSQAGYQPATSPDSPEGRQKQPVTRRRHGRRLDDAKIIAAYQGGATIQQCTDQFGTSASTVLGILRQHEVPTRTRGKPKNLDPAIEQALVVAYRDRRVTLEQCADWFAISRGTVTRILQRHGVPARPTNSHSAPDPAQVIGIPRQPKMPTRAGRHTKMLSPGAEQAVIAAYRDQGLTMEQCAGRFDISRATVKRTLRRHEVPARPRGSSR